MKRERVIGSLVVLALCAVGLFTGNSSFLNGHNADRSLPSANRREPVAIRQDPCAQTMRNADSPQPQNNQPIAMSIQQTDHREAPPRWAVAFGKEFWRP